MNLVPLTVPFSYAIDECLELCADRVEIDGRGEDEMTNTFLLIVIFLSCRLVLRRNTGIMQGSLIRINLLATVETKNWQAFLNSFGAIASCGITPQPF